MTDFNKVLDCGDYMNGFVNAVIDIPLGSTLKIEWDREKGCFFLDRVEPDIYPKPVNYGFIPKTLDEDGDELDILVYCRQPIMTGVYVNVKIIGILNFEDDGEMDYKVVGVPADDRSTGDSINSLDDLGERWKQMIVEHFRHYKDLKKPGTTKVLGWGNIKEAQKVIQESIERFQQK